MTQNPAVSTFPPQTDPQPPYFKIVGRWLFVAASVAILTVLAGLYIVRQLLPQVYEATATLQVGPREEVIPGPRAGENPAPSSAELTPTQAEAEFEIIRSPEVILPVIHELGMDKGWTHGNLQPPDENSDKALLTHAETLLKTDYVRGTNNIKITLSSDVPQEAADFANALADRYQALRNIEEEPRNGTNTLQDPDIKAVKSPVRILSRAETPILPSRPNKSVATIVVLFVAGFLGIVLASFVEVVVMLLRASQRE